MLRGGYKIIDLQDKDIDTDGSNLTLPTGTYEAIESNYRKPLRLSNIVLDSVEKNDIYIEVSVSNSNFVWKAYGFTWTLTDDDELTLVALTNAKGGK